MSEKHYFDGWMWRRLLLLLFLPIPLALLMVWFTFWIVASPKEVEYYSFKAMLRRVMT